MRSEWTYTLLIVVGAILTGCGGAAPPTQRLASAEAAVRGARELGATEEPRAALHLKLAQEQVEKAKRHIQDDLNIQADLSLQRALADAELAIAIAREAKMVAEARAAKEEVAKLRAEQQQQEARQTP